MDYDTLKQETESGSTIKEIAMLNGLAQSSVRYWLRKHDLRTKRGPRGKVPKDLLLPRSCACGEKDPAKFYGHKKKYL